jgi:hypothetical protein
LPFVLGRRRGVEVDHSPSSSDRGASGGERWQRPNGDADVDGLNGLDKHNGKNKQFNGLNGLNVAGLFEGGDWRENDQVNDDEEQEEEEESEDSEVSRSSGDVNWWDGEGDGDEGSGRGPAAAVMQQERQGEREAASEEGSIVVTPTVPLRNIDDLEAGATARWGQVPESADALENGGSDALTVNVDQGPSPREDADVGFESLDSDDVDTEEDEQEYDEEADRVAFPVRPHPLTPSVDRRFSPPLTPSKSPTKPKINSIAKYFPVRPSNPPRS